MTVFSKVLNRDNIYHASATIVCLYCIMKMTKMVRKEFENKAVNNKAVIVMFNKYDIFRDCIEKGISLKNCFDEYDGNEFINYLLPLCVSGVIRDIQKYIHHIIPQPVIAIIEQYAVHDDCFNMNKEQYVNVCCDDALKYIANEYLKTFEGKNIRLSMPLHIHKMNALDTDNIDKIFRDIRLDLVKLNLKHVS